MKDTSVKIISQSLKGKRVALCVTGGIAACEVVKLARALRRYSAEVQVYMTPGATAFITPLSLEWAAQNKVVTELSSRAEHIVDADMVLVAPATLNTINKIAHGFADNVVTTTVASAWGQGLPIVIVPTMNESLSNHPILKKNIFKLKKEKSFYFIEPILEEGKDKFPEVSSIVSQVCHALHQSSALAGKHILLTAGPTKAAIDPVRFLANFSTGELGIELSKRLYENGALPTLVYGPGSTKPHDFYPVVNVTTPADMLEAVETEVSYKKYDAAIFAAAVLDHVPSVVARTKLSSEKPLTIQTVQTAKIIREVDHFTRKKCESVTKNLYKIGFKLEWEKTNEQLFEIGQSALESMNAQVVVLNNLNEISDQSHKALIIDRALQMSEVSSKDEIINTLIEKLTYAL